MKKNTRIIITTLTLLALNFACFIYWLRTLISWLEFIKWSVIIFLPLPFIALILYKIFNLEQGGTLLKRFSALVMPTGIMYVTFILFLPYGINYHFGKNKKIIVQAKNVRVGQTSQRDRISHTIYIGYNYKWTHNGFTKRISLNNYYGTEVSFTSYKGLFGWEVVKDITFQDESIEWPH